MKFTVRDGFVVSFVERKTAVIAGAEKIVEQQVNEYPGSEPFTLTEDQAREHAHKIEGADKEGKAVLASLVRDPSTSQAEPSVPLSQVQDLVAAEVAKAIAALKPAA